MFYKNQNTSIDLLITNQPIELVRPDLRNPRKHSKQQIQQIANCIGEFGFVVPIVVDGSNKILSGHGRYAAAKLLGATHIPVIRLEHLTPAQARIFSIADNRLVENSEWHDDLLAGILLELSNADLSINLDLTGFSVTEIDLRIADQIEGKPNTPDPADELIEKSGPIISKLGDIWLLGKHRIICGNSLEEATFTLLMNGLKAHMIISDSPFNVRINGHVGGNGAIKHKEFAFASGEMSPTQFIQFLTVAFGLQSKYSVDNSVHYQFCDWRHLEEFMTAGKSAYHQLINLVVWVKNSGALGSFYRSRHELILVYVNGKGPRRNNVQLGKYGRNRTNVWEYPGILTMSKQSEEGNLLLMHPTVKGVAMIADAILDCTSRGEIVLDAFLGSGTTVLAAERVGRVCHGIEIEPKYVDVAIMRWQRLTGESAIHAQSGKSFDQLTQEMEAHHD
ncbi:MULTISPECIES: DNA methyltransferase [unclassified Polynucleobacter]|uniref:site-specific DNA-methyltransferase n=1 Tax=unclassified Polynucleobacter TaxID=2640945 RepID=UPI0008AED76D|nr:MULTISPECIES: DNA methyltransferase [unclassified Polynucleobacter]OHC09968.1 MAG: DNA methylase N-4 [Polynucleobacter sp. GWA2_45_21]HBK43056.1 DNA methylase N-4 [Polynucleobacter sp.]